MAFSAPQGLPSFNFPGPSVGAGSLVFTPLPAIKPAEPATPAAEPSQLVQSTLSTLTSLHQGWSDWQQQRPAAPKAAPAPIPPWMNPAASMPVAFQVARPATAPAPLAPAPPPPQPFVPPSFMGPPPGLIQNAPSIAPPTTRGFGTGWSWRDAMNQPGST